jgi:hypothetical protein
MIFKLYQDSKSGPMIYSLPFLRQLVNEGKVEIRTRYDSPSRVHHLGLQIMVQKQICAGKVVTVSSRGQFSEVHN